MKARTSQQLSEAGSVQNASALERLQSFTICLPRRGRSMGS